MTPSERRRARNEQKRNMKKDVKKEVNEQITRLLRELDDLLVSTNRLIPSKTTGKAEVLADGSIFDKRFIVNTQNLFKPVVESTIRELLAKVTQPQTRQASRNRNYSRPCYFRESVVRWLLDENVSFKANNVSALINNEDGTETTEYSGQELAEVLIMTRQANIELDETIQDGSRSEDNKIEVPLYGLANRSIIGDLINCYMSKNNLKGVEVSVKKKGKNGEEIIEKKVNNSYWRIDDTMLKYFGDVIDEIVEKERKKAGGKTPITSDGIEISRRCIKNGAMAIMSAMVDTEANNKFKDYLDELQPMIDVDASLTREVYHRIVELKK